MPGYFRRSPLTENALYGKGRDVQPGRSIYLERVPMKMSVGELTKPRFIIVSRARPKDLKHSETHFPKKSGFTLSVYGMARKSISTLMVNSRTAQTQSANLGILLKRFTSAQMRGVMRVREGVISVASLMKSSSLMCHSPRMKLSRSAVALKVFLRSMLQAKPLPLGVNSNQQNRHLSIIHSES